jgi:hypothetical protein
VSTRLVQFLALTCCLLLACQTRTVLVQAPRTPTSTPQPLVVATPATVDPAASPVSGPAVAASPSAVTSPVVAGSPGAGPSAGASAASPVVPSSPAVASAPSPVTCRYGPTRRQAEVQERALKEASALAASQRWPGIYWTLNDSGNTPSVFAVDEQGRARGTFRIEGVENVDWESMQVGPGRDGGAALYIGDIGDNDRERREVVIYRVSEPEPGPVGGRSTNGRTAQAEAFKIQYPNGARDAEGLLVHPKTGEILIVTKEVLGRAGVYRVPQPLDARRTTRLERVAEVDMGRVGVKIDVVTDATVSADARRVTIRTYGSALEYDVSPGAQLTSIWDQTPRVSRLDDGPQGEGITYRAHGGALISIGESTPANLFETPWQC